MSAVPQPRARYAEAQKEALLEAFRKRFSFGARRFVPRRGKAVEAGEAAQALSRQEWRVVAREALTLHEAYTVGRKGFAHGENPIHALQAGYQFYYLPRNVFRVRYVLEQLPWRGRTVLARVMPLVEEEGPGAALNILDLGCGSGAFSLALLGWLAEGRRPGEELPALRIVLVDQGRAVLGLAEANVRALLGRVLPEVPVAVEVRPEGVESYLTEREAGERFGIVGAAMMLNELNLLTPGRSGRRAARFTVPLRRLLREGGLALFVEPGTRKGYMNVMAVREQLEGLPVLFPCPHGKPCPLWSPKVRRWCHATRPLPRPFGFDRELRELGQMAFEMRELNLAALALQAVPGGAVRAPFEKLHGSRVVSGKIPPRKSGKPGKRRKGSGEERAASETAPPPVALCCGKNGKLSEIPAGGLGAYPRGLWLEDGEMGAAGAPGAGRGKEKWARKR